MGSHFAYKEIVSDNFSPKLLDHRYSYTLGIDETVETVPLEIFSWFEQKDPEHILVLAENKYVAKNLFRCLEVDEAVVKWQKTYDFQEKDELYVGILQNDEETKRAWKSRELTQEELWHLVFDWWDVDFRRKSKQLPLWGGLIMDGRKAQRYVISSTFSVKMLEPCFHELTFEPILESCAHELLQDVHKREPEKILSIVGHESTARLFSRILGFEVPENRVDYTFKVGDALIVGVPNIKRLPEGKVLDTEELERLADFQWWFIRFA